MGQALVEENETVPEYPSCPAPPCRNRVNTRALEIPAPIKRRPCAVTAAELTRVAQCGTGCSKVVWRGVPKSNKVDPEPAACSRAFACRCVCGRREQPFQKSGHRFVRASHTDAITACKPGYPACDREMLVGRSHELFGASQLVVELRGMHRRQDRMLTEMQVSKRATCCLPPDCFLPGWV